MRMSDNELRKGSIYKTRETGDSKENTHILCCRRSYAALTYALALALGKKRIQYTGMTS